MITNTKKTFKDRIIKCIGKKKPTSWGLSIGLDTGVITRIFSHNKIPTWKHLITISIALDKPIDWLLTGKEYTKSGTDNKVSEKQSKHQTGNESRINKSKVGKKIEGRLYDVENLSQERIDILQGIIDSWQVGDTNERKEKRRKRSSKTITKKTK